MADNIESGSKWGVEWWYNAHFVYGAIQMVFIPILIPTFILELTGSASTVGILMGIIGLGGLTAPILGGLADKYRAHRIVQLIGLAAYVAAGGLFAFSGEAVWLYYVAAGCLGVGSASLLMLNPAFIVSAGFSQDSEALRLTRLNQIAILGSLVAGIGLSALTATGLSYQTRFLVMSAIAALSFVLTALTNTEAASRIRVEVQDAGENTAPQVGIGTILFSPFGVFLAATFLITIGHGVITGQYPNYMQKVFSVDPSLSSVGLSVSAVVSLIILGAVGKWMANKGPVPVWASAVLMKTAMMAAMSVLAIVTGNIIYLIPLGIYVIFLQGITWADMVQPSLSARLSSAGAGATQGFLLFAVAIGYAAGNVIGGVSADILGFQSLAWIVCAVMIPAFFLAFISFRKLSKT